MKQGYRHRRKAKYVNPLDIILLGDEPFGVSRILDIALPPFRDHQPSIKLDGLIFIDSNENEVTFDENDYVDILVEP